MAEIQELDNEVGEIEAVSDAKVAQQDPQPVVNDDDDLPSEYKGKSKKELVKIAQDRHVMIGRQAQEVGEVRRLADELLKSQLSKKPEEVKPEEIDFFENPQEAIRQAVANSPDVVNARNMAVQMKQQSSVNELARKHPDFGQIVQDGEFVQWVNSSKQRTKMFNEAQAYDVDAADELLSNFKIQKSVKQQHLNNVVSDTEKAARDKSLMAASVDTGGSGEGSQKVWKRADLIRLKISDPNKYDSMNDEILKAYSEGRVK